MRTTTKPKDKPGAIRSLQKKAGVRADGMFGPMTARAAAKFLGLNTFEAAHFFGQCMAETTNFKSFSENLNYSPSALRKVFGKYYRTDKLAEAEARNPEKIANRVYGGRMGNESPGDGWKFRGRGALQLTGRNNYGMFALWQKDYTIMNDPDQVATKYAFESARWYFEINGIQRCVDIDDSTILTISRIINVGNANSSVTPHGMDLRTSSTKKVHKWLIS